MSLLIKLPIGYQEVYTRDPAESDSPTFRLWSKGGDAFVGLKAPNGMAADETWVYTWVKEFARLGESALLCLDDAGNLDVLHPDWVENPPVPTIDPTYSQANIEAAFATIIGHQQDILDLLRDHKIAQTVTIAITPEPATAIFRAIGPTTIVPEPATMILGVTRAPRMVASAIFRTVDPAVQVDAGSPERRVIPAPAIMVLSTTMHHQWITAVPASMVLSTVDPTVTIA